jgi:hypothetical protein
MRNKWFVGGLLVPALFFTWATIACLRGSMGIFALAPAAISIGLYAAAWKVSQAASFAPQGPARFDSGTSDAVRRWNKDRDERDTAAKEASRAADTANGDKP